MIPYCPKIFSRMIVLLISYRGYQNFVAWQDLKWKRGTVLVKNASKADERVSKSRIRSESLIKPLLLLSTYLMFIFLLSNRAEYTHKHQDDITLILSAP